MRFVPLPKLDGTTLDEVYMHNYVPSGEWEIIKTKFVTDIKELPDSLTKFPRAHFTIRIRRNPVYYFSHIIAPCFVIYGKYLCLCILR